MGPIAKAIKNAMNKKSGNDAADATESDLPVDGSGEYVRQGRLCCGCLCDMRRAVVIMSGIGIVFQGASIGLNRWRIESAKDKTVDPGDLNKLDDLFMTMTIVSCVSMVMLFVAMMGGILFRRFLVIPNAIFLPVAVVVAIVLNYNVDNDVDAFNYGPADFVGQIFGLVFAEYAYFSFYTENRNGIMTKESYPNEEHSCCCV